MQSREEAALKLTAYQDRLDEARKQGTAPYEDALSSSPAGVGVHEIDNDHVLVRVNAEELRLLGYAAEQMVGRRVWSFIVMQEASQRAIDEKLKSQKDLRPFVRSFRRKDGTSVTLLLLDRRLYDAAGNIVGIRTALTEIPGLES
jgi:PAS domain S-box-containing protein